MHVSKNDPRFHYNHMNLTGTLERSKIPLMKKSMDGAKYPPPLDCCCYHIYSLIYEMYYYLVPGLPPNNALLSR